MAKARAREHDLKATNSPQIIIKESILVYFRGEQKRRNASAEKQKNEIEFFALFLKLTEIDVGLVVHFPFRAFCVRAVGAGRINSAIHKVVNYLQIKFVPFVYIFHELLEIASSNEAATLHSFIISTSVAFITA